ncbi:MAG: DUF1223 domain-containing protein [Pseudomonadota bacterium]
MKNIALAARALFCATLGLATLPNAAQAEPAVVVELFTSQGCYSCPPADEVLGKLAEHDDIIALSLHVDYWDYLGWRDTFAKKAFTRRQFEYRDSMGERVVYTPQMIVQGANPVTGSRAMSVRDAIAQVRSTDDLAKVEIVERNGGLKGLITPVNGGEGSSAVVYVAKYTRSETVQIARGENGGKTLTYHNVVGMLSPLKDWRGDIAEYDLPNPGPGEGIALWVQGGKVGPILAAAKFER